MGDLLRPGRRRGAYTDRMSVAGDNQGTDRGAKGSVDLSDEQVHWDLGSSQSYGECLRLDLLLSAQQPVTSHHDEMLFIIIHQASELWIKLCLHEIGAATDCIRRDDLGPSFKMLSRVSRIQTQLTQSWDVLSTMTPFDYSNFRNDLGRASGFSVPISTACSNSCSATSTRI